MKKIYFVLFFISSISSQTQNYELFNSSTKKLFASYPEIQSTYSLVFDSVNEVGDYSVYYNFYKIEDYNFTSYDCDFWGGPECFKQSVPVWVGSKVEYDNEYSYNFYSDNGDTIHFYFNPNSVDSAIFYEDTVQMFSLIYLKADTINLINYSDSARFFKILHTDLDGNEINSVLNNQEIIIGKELGLIQFFHINYFPQILMSVKLIGQEEPEIGITNITNEMLYNYQVGDEMQYHESFNSDFVPPWEKYSRFRKHIILDRTTTLDSIIYLINEFVFYEDSLLLEENLITKKYHRKTILAQLPFELFDGINRKFYLKDYCEFKLWTYKVIPDYSLIYCEFDNVWGPTDTQGPPFIESTTYTLGLGDYHYWKYRADGGLFFDLRKEIIYFQKDGISCGDEVIMGIKNQKERKHQIKLFPNPAKNKIHILGKSLITSCKLRNSFGEVVMIQEINKTRSVINVSHLPAGIYFTRIELADGTRETMKVLITK